MSKLPKEHKFIDVSDYGRPFAKMIVNNLKDTKYTPIDVTIWFIISGIIGILCISAGYYWLAGFFLIFKSILDAADGELARAKNTPSHTGRYFDSISDIILNLMIFVTLSYVTNDSLIVCLIAFALLQLQGTLYNYYYVILRNKLNGDKTSRVFEHEAPKALGNEKQRTVNRLFFIYTVLYGIFDKIIYTLDSDAIEMKKFPKKFMTIVSTFGLGFQLLIISFLLALGYKNFIADFFIYYSILIIVLIIIRKMINKKMTI